MPVNEEDQDERFGTELERTQNVWIWPRTLIYGSNLLLGDDLRDRHAEFSNKVICVRVSIPVHLHCQLVRTSCR